MEVEQETAGVGLEMETAEGEETMSKHLPECHRVDDPDSIHAWCLCDELAACEQRIWAEMYARIEDRMTDTDMDNLVSDDGKDYFWSVLRSMKPFVRYPAQSLESA